MTTNSQGTAKKTNQEYALNNLLQQGMLGSSWDPVFSYLTHWPLASTSLLLLLQALQMTSAHISLKKKSESKRELPPFSASPTHHLTSFQFPNVLLSTFALASSKANLTTHFSTCLFHLTPVSLLKSHISFSKSLLIVSVMWPATTTITLVTMHLLLCLSLSDGRWGAGLSEGSCCDLGALVMRSPLLDGHEYLLPIPHPIKCSYFSWIIFLISSCPSFLPSFFSISFIFFFLSFSLFLLPLILFK